MLRHTNRQVLHAFVFAVQGTVAKSCQCIVLLDKGEYCSGTGAHVARSVSNELGTVELSKLAVNAH